VREGQEAVSSLREPGLLQPPEKSPKLAAFLDDSETDVLSYLDFPNRSAANCSGLFPLLTAISRMGISFQLPVIPESGVYSITHDPVHAEMPPTSTALCRASEVRIRLPPATSQERIARTR
jgi:hypothetical protein